jgi:hypothetical protein
MILLGYLLQRENSQNTKAESNQPIICIWSWMILRKYYLIFCSILITYVIYNLNYLQRKGETHEHTICEEYVNQLIDFMFENADVPVMLILQLAKFKLLSHISNKEHECT